MGQKSNKPVKQPNPYIRFTTIAFQMGITIYLGSELGKWLDVKFPNDNQLFYKIISLVAIFIAIYSVIKQVQKITNQDQ